MSISKEVMQENKNFIISTLKTVERQGANIDGLITKLESSDFFTAPASTRFHNSFEGGLADHVINVYYNLKSLVERKHLQDTISEDSIIICGLLHDMSKINFYKPTIKNKKVYSENGSKYDTLGNYDWVSEYQWSVVDESERFIYGNHEENSEFMVRYYIPLTLQESIAILHHHGGKGYDSTPQNLLAIMNDNPLLTLLHVADMISTYVDERVQ